MTAARAGRRSQLTQQGQDRREDILRQASALFVERGYADTRMVDIATAAGVAKGLCYWYFATKEDLLTELVTDLQSRLRREQREAISGLSEPLDRLYAATIRSVLFVAEHKRLYQQFFANAAGAGVATLAKRAHDDDTAALLRWGQAEGSIRTDEDPRTMAFGNSGVVNNVSFAFADGLLGDDLQAVAEGVARYIVRAVAAAPQLAEDVIGRRSSQASTTAP